MRTITEAAHTYDLAIDRLVRYHPDVVTLTTELVTEQPDYAMGHALASYLSLSSTDVPDLPGARASASELARLDLTPRETAHQAAIERWLAGDWHGAARALDELLVEWPADVLALLAGHQLDFFRGDAANLRDRVARSVRRIDPADPVFGFVQGMFAFGLEESGDYQAAERNGLAAVEAHGDDVWAIHAVAHVYEMQGRIDEGIAFMRGRQADWGAGNLFMVHNWWHLALYFVEAGRVQDALAIYDAQVHNASSAGVPLELLDAERVALAPLSGGRRHRSPVRRHRRRMGDSYERGALVRVQRSARRRRLRRCEPPRRRPCGRTATRAVRRGRWRGEPEQHRDDRGDRPSVVPRRHRDCRG